MKMLTLIVSMALSAPAFAAEVYSVDQSTPVETQLAENCPWIDPLSVRVVSVSNPQDIGKIGGKVGKVLGKLKKVVGTTNNSKISANLPAETKALVFNMAYYNNNKQAQVVIDDLYLISADGHKVSLGLDEESKVLQQTADTAGESLLICFTADENYVRISTSVSHNNVDGARPTIGISALSTQDTLLVPQP